MTCTKGELVAIPYT